MPNKLETSCWACGGSNPVLAAAGQIIDRPEPADGDATVCKFCARIGVFTGASAGVACGQRPPSDDEMIALMRYPLMQRMLRKAQLFIMQYN